MIPTERHTRRATLGRALEDAVRVIDESDSDQESGPDIYKNNIYILSRSFQRKFCFLTISQMFLNGIDFYLEH